MFTSTLSTPPAAVFSRSPRDTFTAKKHAPGPEYAVQTAIGVCSTLPSSPRASFGVGPRSSPSPTRSNAIEVGPADYAPPAVLGSKVFDSAVRAAPAFSLKSRHAEVADQRTRNPAPNAYNVPRLVGGSPTELPPGHSGSILSGGGSRASARSASPVRGGAISGAVAVSTVRSPPAWTMRPRTVPSEPRALSPGPAAYGLPAESQTSVASPAFSIRPRTRQLGQGMAASDLGPAAYGDAPREALGVLGRSPAYSLRPRTVDPAEVARARSVSPAPNTYRVPAAIGQSPLWPNTGGAFSLRGRHSEPKRLHTPSPLDYNVGTVIGSGHVVLSDLPNAPSTRLGTGGPKIVHVLGGSTPADVGPLSYRVPSAFMPANDHSPFKRSGMGHSLKSRQYHGSVEEAPLLVASPGPAAYGRPELGSVVQQRPQPRFGTSPRMETAPEDRFRATTPAPGAYDPNDRHTSRASPAYSMRSRTASPTRHADSLGPAAFNLQGVSMRRGSPAWSLRMRWRPDRASDVPGPGAYGTLALPHVDLLLQRTAHLRLPSGESARRSTSPVPHAGAQGAGASPSGNVSFRQSYASTAAGGSPGREDIAGGTARSEQLSMGSGRSHGDGAQQQQYQQAGQPLISGRPAEAEMAAAKGLAALPRAPPGGSPVQVPN